MFRIASVIPLLKDSTKKKSISILYHFSPCLVHFRSLALSLSSIVSLFLFISVLLTLALFTFTHNISSPLLCLSFCPNFSEIRMKKGKPETYKDWRLKKIF